MHLRQPGLTYRSCEPFTNKKQRKNTETLTKKEIHDIIIKTN